MAFLQRAGHSPTDVSVGGLGCAWSPIVAHTCASSYVCLLACCCYHLFSKMGFWRPPVHESLMSHSPSYLFLLNWSIRIGPTSPQSKITYHLFIPSLRGEGVHLPELPSCSDNLVLWRCDLAVSSQSLWRVSSTSPPNRPSVEWHPSSPAEAMELPGGGGLVSLPREYVWSGAV